MALPYFSHRLIVIAGDSDVWRLIPARGCLRLSPVHISSCHHYTAEKPSAAPNAFRKKPQLFHVPCEALGDLAPVAPSSLFLLPVSYPRMHLLCQSYQWGLPPATFIMGSPANCSPSPGPFHCCSLGVKSPLLLPG